MNSVQTVLAALADAMPDYELIRDCVAGQTAIKKKRNKYLPDPDEGETNVDARNKRYQGYLDRAVFYGATGRTLRGLVGMVFHVDPAVQLPTQMEIMAADVNGGSVPLDQQASATLSSVVSLGRAGLFTDYPTTNGQPTTVADAKAGNVRPVVLRYEPEDVINWRTATVGSKILLTLVVLHETYVVQDDGFAEVTGNQYRVLRLTNLGGTMRYTQEIWRDIQDPISGQNFVSQGVMTPTDGKGQPFQEIPFTFVGALDNDPSVDPPPLLDLAQLNKAHYQNSADFEESVFMVGQPTLALAGVTKDWVTNVLKNDIRLGSRGAIPLPAGGKAELIQADPNTLAKDAMEHKEKQMIALGAKLIENTGTQQTATEATIDAVMDTSVLGTCARNVSKAYVKSLNWAWQYMTGEVVDDPEKIDYELNTDFEAQNLTAADRDNIVGMWQKRAITYTEMRWNLKRSGTAYLDDAEAQAESQSELETSIENEAAAAQALADAQPQQPGQPAKGPPTKKPSGGA